MNIHVILLGLEVQCWGIFIELWVLPFTHSSQLLGEFSEFILTILIYKILTKVLKLL